MAQTGHTASAAKACVYFVAKFNDKSYNDWFLPSKDELELMYLTLKKKNTGNFKDDFYWSSSEDDGVIAWYQVFGNGYQYYDGKYGDNNVRCVRAF